MWQGVAMDERGGAALCKTLYIVVDDVRRLLLLRVQANDGNTLQHKHGPHHGVSCGGFFRHGAGLVSPHGWFCLARAS